MQCRPRAGSLLRENAAIIVATQATKRVTGSMPLQNRVDPFGEIHAVTSRGTLMGNRGILHDEHRILRRKYAHANWVTCALAFKDRKRALMTAQRYTELFFYDEATAFAAGHRPCAQCRRARYASFVAAWCDTHGRPEAATSVPQSIDRILHAARTRRGGQKVTYQAPRAELPDGTIFTEARQPVLVWNRALYWWTFDGYRRANIPAGDTCVTVLTPKPIVAVFAAGWRPLVGIAGA